MKFKVQDLIPWQLAGATVLYGSCAGERGMSPKGPDDTLGPERSRLSIHVWTIIGGCCGGISS